MPESSVNKVFFHHTSRHPFPIALNVPGLAIAILIMACFTIPACTAGAEGNSSVNVTPTLVVTVTTAPTTLPPETTVTTLAVTNATTVPTTTLPTETVTNTSTTPVTTTVSVTPHEPLVRIDTPVITNESVTITGSAVAGTVGTTLTAITWDWGDGNYDAGPFPKSHTYSKPGTYLVTVDARQSDNLSAQSATVVVITPSVQVTVSITPSSPEIPPVTPSSPEVTTVTPVAPGTTAITPVATATSPPTPTRVPPPVIILTEPVVDGLRVTLSGEVRAGSPAQAVSRLSWNWGDGTTSENLTFPVSHTYPAPGTYTLNVKAMQTDGQQKEKEVVFTITMPGLPDGGGGIPPGDGGRPGGPDPALVGVILLVAGFAGGGAVYLGFRKFGGESGASISIAIRQSVDNYQSARERGDIQAARLHAAECARLLRKLAVKRPGIRMRYIEKAEIWEAVARSVGSQGEVGRPPAVREARAAIDTVALLEDDFDEITAGTDVDPAVLSAVVRVAREIAREGREGKPIGTAFVVGDTTAVMERSTQFVLNPFKGHEAEDRNIADPATWENIKEFSLLDGAFIIAGDGTVEAAGRYITVDTSKVRIPKGLGSRHASIAGITLTTHAIGVVVSQSGGVVKIFRNGEIRRTYHP